MMVTTRAGWVFRILTYTFFICYGMYSIFYPLISVERAVDHWVEILLGVDFIIAGAAMIHGLWHDNFKVWKLGMSVAFIGLSTVTLVIAFAGGFRVLAYAFLFGAFACQSIYSIVRERTRLDEEDIRRQLEAIVKSVRPEGVEL